MKITIKKRKLLAKLLENKTLFVESYEALLKAYKEESEKYKKAYAEFSAKIAENQPQKDDETTPMPPPVPVDRRKDYDFYIAMLEKHAGREIAINEDDYKRLYNNQWEWRRLHYNTLAFYARAGGASSGAINYLDSWEG